MSDIKFIVTVDSKKGEVSLKQLDKGVAKLGETAKKTDDGFKGLWKQILAGAGATVGIAAAVRGLAKLAGSFMDVSIQVEQYEKRLKVLLGSQEAANEAMDYFQELAANLPFTLEDVITAGTRLATIKVPFEKWLPRIADLAASMGMELPIAVDQMSRALSAGLGAADRFREMGVTAMIRAFAKEKMAIKDLSQESLPTLERVLFEFLGTQAGGAEELKETWTGMVSMLDDAWFQFRDRIMEAGIFEMMKGGLQDVLSWIDKFKREGGFEDVALQVSMTGEVLGILRGEIKRQLAPLRLLRDMVIGATKRENKFQEATDDLRESMARLGREQLTSTELTHYQASEMMTAAESADIFARRAKALAFNMQDVWTALRPPSQIMEEWDALFALIETPELDLQMEQFAISAENNFAEVIESMGFFVREAEELSEGWNTALEGMTAAQLEFSSLAIQRFLSMEASLKGFVGAILGTLEDWAIGQLIPTIMAALPFPANLLAVGGAVLFIKSWFAQLGKAIEPEGKAEGGWVGLQGPEIIKVGERGPEFVTKTEDIQNIYNQMGRTINVTIVVKDQLDPYTAQRITRQQIIPQILDSLDVNENKKKWQERLR